GYVTAVPTRPLRELPCYVFIVEKGDIPEEGRAKDFLEAVDRKLSATNFLYGARRREQVLGSPQLWRIPTGAWSQYVESEIARRGTGDVQYKHPGLVQDGTWLNQFQNVDIVTRRSRRQAAA